MNEILENKKLKEFPFDIPQGYFSTLEGRVRARIDSENENKSAKVWRTIKASIALAAAFLLIMGLGGVVLKYSTGAFNSNNIVAEQIDDEIVDSIQTLLLQKGIYTAFVEDSDVEAAYNQIVESINENEDLSEAEFEEIIKEYLNTLPTTYSNLLAEEFNK